MPEAKRFPDTFLDYIPPPAMGIGAYRRGLERSYEQDTSDVHPLYALLKVTNRCNSKCVYCGHAGNKYREGDMSTGVLTGVLDQLADLGTVSVNFTGGEPLLRSDLPDLARHAKKRGLFPILLTNGMLLRKRCDDLRGAGFGMVIVSMDSVQPQVYRATRQVPLKPVLDGIEKLLAWPADERPVVTVTAVVTAQNLEHLQELISYCGRRSIGVELTPYHHHGKRGDNVLSPRNRRAYQKMMDRISRLKSSGAGVINSQAYIDNFAAFNFKNRSLPAGYRCYCGYTTLYIDAALNVRSCWSEGLPTAGNLQQQSLRDILDCPKMEAVRWRIRALKCEKCWLLCTAEISLRFQ